MKAKISLILVLFISTVFAQVLHKVKPKETVYGISKQYDVTQEELLQVNPTIQQNGLNIDDVITIPGKESDFTKDESKIVRKDQNYYYLKIAPKETLYAISKKYGTTVEVLKDLNPELKDGLKDGSVIKIPLNENMDVTIDDSQTVDSSINVQDFLLHKIRSGETLFTIMELYHISFDDILGHNPNLVESGLIVGDELQIPAWHKPEMLTKYQDGEINLLLMLPFQMNLNASSAKARTRAIDFLTGVNMALDSLSFQGKKIKLKVVDTENNKKTVETFVRNYKMNQVDAVVGPLYGEMLQELAKSYQQAYLPIFSPVNNDVKLESYNNVFIANTRDEYLVDELIKEVQKLYAGEEILILTDNDDTELANYAKNQMEFLIENAKARVIKNINDLAQPSEVISETLADGTKFKQEYFTPIITILVSNDNSLGKLYVNKIKKMDASNLKAFGVKYVSSYDTSRRNQKNIAALQNIGFTYSTDRLVNVFGKKEKRLIHKFKSSYCKSPNKYQQIGFDLMYDLVSRMDENGYFTPNIYNKQSQFSTNFQYRASENKNSYVNHGVRILRLYKKEKPVEVQETDLID